ncbi:MAG TPA: chemotaxis protein CheA [Bacteroidales bacterium]|nr:chemotaxis protein CheA [Bacteroidales bacterium]
MSQAKNFPNDKFAIDMVVLKQKFTEEAYELINDLENAVLLLEKNAGDTQQIEAVFRAMHTLKGSGGMFGYHKISEFTHDLETIYDFVRSGDIAVTKPLLDITLKAIDHLKILIKYGDDLDEQSTLKHQQFTADIRVFVQQQVEPFDKESAAEIGKAALNDSKPIVTWRILFKPQPDLFRNGSNPLYLIDELHTYGNTVTIPHTEEVPDLSEIDTEKCYVWWEIFIATRLSKEELNDVFIFVEDDSHIEVEKIGDGDLFDDSSFLEYLDKLWIEKKQADLVELHKIVYSSDVSDQPAPAVSPSAEKGDEETKPLPDNNSAIIADEKFSSIRVATPKIDSLMNLVSELVTLQAQLNRYAEQHKDDDLTILTENLSTLSKQLREAAFSISLVPFSSISTRFQRLVRDLSDDLNKKTELVVEGQNIELDKTMVENITDPLMHIIRNCIDHGIESPEERVRNGKSETGTIHLRALHVGNTIHIEINDDGAGVDAEALMRKAIERKVIPAEAKLTHEEKLQLIFSPGLTTAKTVTDVSGRGVGMDVVQQRIAGLRGEIRIDSQPGTGTRITLVVPLTLSIIDGMHVQIGEVSYIIPINVVQQIHSVQTQMLSNAFDNVLVIEGEQIPFLLLRKHFGIESPAPERCEMVTVRYGQQKAGLIVDNVIGEVQAVLKSLGRTYRRQKFISGATVMGDGTVALVLDTNEIISRFLPVKSITVK